MKANAECGVRSAELEKVLRCALRAFDKYLNTVETRIIKRAAARLSVSRFALRAPR